MNFTMYSDVHSYNIFHLFAGDQGAAPVEPAQAAAYKTPTTYEEFIVMELSAIEARMKEIRAIIEHIEKDCDYASKIIHSTSITIDSYSRTIQQAERKQEEFKATLASHKARIANQKAILAAAEEAHRVICLAKLKK